MRGTKFRAASRAFAHDDGILDSMRRESIICAEAIAVVTLDAP